MECGTPGTGTQSRGSELPAALSKLTSENAGCSAVGLGSKPTVHRTYDLEGRVPFGTSSVGTLCRDCR